MANVLRFLLIEYVIIKLLHHCVESLSSLIARNRLRRGENITISDGLLTFFHIPYRLRERKIFNIIFSWVIVILLNAFLISIEFGFSSEERSSPVPDVFVTTPQEIALDALGASTPMQGVSPRRWIDRLERLHGTCVGRQEKHRLRIFAADGFMTDEFVSNDSSLFFAAKPTCATDDRVKSNLPQLLFDVSYAGLKDVEDPFQFASANLRVDEIIGTDLGFRVADVDLQVSGRLDLSLSSLRGEEFLFDVSGVCTGDRVVNLSDAEDSPHMLCYLTDSADHRFIVPGIVQSDTSQYTALGDIEAGDSFEISGEEGVFRAKFLPYLDGGFKPKDGDHLAAIKTFAVSFGTRGKVTDETMSLALSPAIRTFCGATLFGITQIRKADVERKKVLGNEGDEDEEDVTERATVRVWTLVVLCLMVGLSGAGSLGFVFANRRAKEEEVPVTFNSLAAKMMERLDVKSTNGLMCTGVHDGTRLRQIAFVEDSDVMAQGGSEGLGTDQEP